MALSAMSDDGKPVDWWFMYKVASESTTSAGARGPVLDGKKVTGLEYLYFDARTPQSGKLKLSPNTVQGGALQKSLNQIYGSTSKSVGWWFYNDEDPLDDEVNSTRGHTKGVVAFDLSSNTAFWLIQSTPKFPPWARYGFPETGTANAQTLLCITLQNADVAQAIARQMYVAQQPHVYLASEVPPQLAGRPNDPRVKLMRDQVASGTTPVHVVLPFRSKGGVKFLSIAKSKNWDLDFYNDLVGPTLKDNLDVETWELDPVPPPEDSDRRHTVVDMTSIDLAALGIDLAWSEDHDHAKLAISARSEPLHYVCVGDLNYTIAQRKRGGGTVAFQCEALWASLSSIVRGVSPFPRTAAADKTSPGLRAVPPPSRLAGSTSKPAGASDKESGGAAGPRNGDVKQTISRATPGRAATRAQRR
jgi:deoxyribonuclease II